MAQITALQPYGVPGRIRTFIAKTAAALTLLNIIGSSAVVTPNHIADLGKNLLIEGDLEVKEKIYVGGMNTTGQYKVDNIQVVSNQGAVVADATNADDVILRLNELLARMRAHGLINT